MQLSGFVLSPCYHYIGTAKNAPKEIQNALDEIGRLRNNLLV